MKDYNKDHKYSDVLERLHSKIVKKEIVSFDVETHDNNQSFTLGSLYDGNDYQIFYDRKQMRDKLLNTRYQNTLLIATNLQFDFCALEDIRKFVEYDIISKSGRFIQIKKRTRYKYKKGNDTKKCVTFANTFIDSLNHYGGSVESAGRVIGIHKFEHPKFLGKKPKDTDEWNELIEYNKRDTEVTYRIMKFLQETYNELGCEMKTTISSTSLDLWRRKYLPQTLYKEEMILGYDIKPEIFKCYYGGRAEIFGRGLLKSDEKNKWKLLDFNSLYPSVMLNEYPLPQSIQKPTSMTIKNIIDYEGFSDVEVECGQMYYPLLPFRDLKRGKLIFPVGRWRASYTHLELRKALTLGYKINKIYIQYIYTKTFKPFEEYVTDLYAKRLEYQRQKSPMELVCKMLLNSLYGKTAQKEFTEYQWFDISKMSDDEYENYLNSDDSTTFENIGFRRVLKECNTNFIFPIIPAYVTSYGRIKLYDAIVKYHGLYCDTDSIITNADVETSKRLGELKVEDRLKSVLIVKPKFYMKETDEKINVKIKGIPRPSIESFDRILQHDRVYFSRFVKANESIRHGYDVNAIREDSKGLDINDNKREWSKPFDRNSFDSTSKPLTIIQTIIPTKKHITKKTIREKMLISDAEHQKVRDKMRKDYIESDLFDNMSVGEDISSEEFIKNEEWFDKHGL